MQMLFEAQSDPADAARAGAPRGASFPKPNGAAWKERTSANPLKCTGQGAEMEARGWESPAHPTAWPWN